jgi:hypothetical protein
MLQFCQKYWPAEHTLRAIAASFRRRVPLGVPRSLDQFSIHRHAVTHRSPIARILVWRSRSRVSGAVAMTLGDAKKKPGFWWRRMFLWMSFGALAGRGMLQFCQKYWPAEHTLRAIEAKLTFEFIGYANGFV